MFVSLFLHSLLAQGLILWFWDVSLSAVEYMKFTNQSAIDAVKLIQLLTMVGLFVIPTLTYAYICELDLKLKFNFDLKSLLLAVAIMFLINPFIAFINEWNMSFNFPDWMLVFDKKAEDVTMYFLKMESLNDLIFNLLVLAIIPAIGEELFFRGYLQQTFVNYFNRKDLAIIITAFLFSAVHMQFQGFLPRFVLGLILGYLFYCSGSLWLPIIAHFINNAMVVSFAYPTLFQYPYFTKNTSTWYEAFLSFMVVALLSKLLIKRLSVKRS